MPREVPALWQCGPITDFSLMIGLPTELIPLPEEANRSRPKLQHRQNTQHFTILQSELAFPSTGRRLPSRPSTTVDAEQSA